MSSGNQRASWAQETLAILDRGEYLSPNGSRMEVRDAQDYAQKHSIHYHPHIFVEVYSRRDQLLADAPRMETIFEVCNCTTLEAARQLLADDPDDDILALNFASAKHPGGGFLGGASAQEESLARSSGLYPCLAQFPEMYDANRTYRCCLYTDDMIYSPKVPVFRSDTGELLDEPYLLSFLTSPAVNVGALKDHERSKIESTMLCRMEKLLSVAVVHGHRTLILGAWGCGVFKNDPADMARWFYHHLVENETFASVFRKVVFAITDWSKEMRFIGPFAEQFGKRSILQE